VPEITANNVNGHLYDSSVKSRIKKIINSGTLYKIACLKPKWDEEGYYEIEITLDNGKEMDVHLDENFNVLSVEYD